VAELYWQGHGQKLYLGDCLDVLTARYFAVDRAGAAEMRRRIPDASVDAVVTDPPYGLEFMGKDWDAPWQEAGINADAGFTAVTMADGGRRLPRPTFTGSTNPGCRNCGGNLRGRRDGTAIRPVCVCDEPSFPNVRAVEMRAYQAWCQAWAAECLRVLKPGGHLLAFGGTRTWHRLACAVEDAGFEIRPSIHWIYGSGFPKSLDVSKAIDKAAGAERVVSGQGPNAFRRPNPIRTGSTFSDDACVWGQGDPITAPATEDAARWEGWGTGLKPAHEPVVVARKPLAGTVAQNVLTHGTGALNLAGCKVGYASEADRAFTETHNKHGDWGSGPRDNRIFGADERARADQGNYDGAAGRWPPNLLLTHSPACELAGTHEVQSNASASKGSGLGYKHDVNRPRGAWGNGSTEIVEAWDCAPDCPVGELDRQSGVSTSTGGTASRSSGDGYRFKAGARAGGLGDTGGASRFFPVSEWSARDLDFAFRYHAKASSAERPGKASEDDEAHPTVKPLGVMLWLTRLVCPPGGTIVDLFAGSGTTLEAAALQGFHVIAAEKDIKSCRLVVERMTDLGGRDRKIRARRPRKARAGQDALW